MTRSLEIKITISEIVTPALFKAMVAISNPRQRAALLKRVAEDALRGTVASEPGSSYADIIGSAMTGTSATDFTTAMAAARAAAPDATTDVPPPAWMPDAPSSPERSTADNRQRLGKPTPTNEDERPFDFAFLADQLGEFG